MKRKNLTKEDKEKWANTNSVNLFVSKEYFHHHSFEILSTYKNIKDKLKSSLSNKIRISTRVKKTLGTESFGIEAKELNIVIRELLQKVKDIDIKFEVYEENGVFYFSSEKSLIGGFDFAILNHYNNILALRNLCFGNLQYADGESRWNKFLNKNPELLEIGNNLKQADKKGENISKSNGEMPIPLVVGEIQFGNWALAYRDFFKVLKADVQNSVDCLIYIVPTGNLEKMLSDGIVTFDKTKKIMEEFAKVISVPVWLVGVDVNI